MYEVLQRRGVLCTTDSPAAAEDIAEAMNAAYPNIPFSWREVS